MLLPRYKNIILEAGCDEAGRGCLAGPVYAAAVILPPDFENDVLTDSKKLSEKQRYDLREIIEREALCWAVESVDNNKIDRINILRASILAMHKALDKLQQIPEFIIVDGNRFYSYKSVPHQCIIKGDGKYLSIAAASILAKTCRDDFMNKIHNEFPQYNWKKNKGYPTKEHRRAIAGYGISSFHRETYKLIDDQQEFPGLWNS